MVELQRGVTEPQSSLLPSLCESGKLSLGAKGGKEVCTEQVNVKPKTCQKNWLHLFSPRITVGS